MEAILTNHTDFFPVGEKAKDLDWLYGAVFYTAVAAVIFIELEFWVEVRQLPITIVSEVSIGFPRQHGLYIY